MKQREIVVISLGGSLIVPGEIDTLFLKRFINLLRERTEKGERFVILTGGGRICRKYQEAAKKVRKLSSSQLDWLGIASTRFNAELLRVLLGRLAEREIILDPTKKIKFRSPIILGGGWKPGFSTDYDAVVIASRTGAKRILNLSNIDYVYDRDPKKSKRAKRIPHISWRNYRKIIPRRWTPGLSTPFDPVAARLAERLRLEVNILGGKSISNIRACLLGTSFKGTSIK